MELRIQNGYQNYDTHTANDAARTVLEQVKRHYQFIPNALGAMVKSPEAVRAYLSLDEIVAENSFSEEQRHVVLLTIAREFLEHGYTRQQILQIITMMANKLIAVFANRVMGTDLDEALQALHWSRVA